MEYDLITQYNDFKPGHNPAQTENIRLNVILEGSLQKFVVVTKKSKSVKELIEQLQEDIFGYLIQTEGLGKSTKKVVKVASIHSKGFTVLQHYKIEDVFTNSEVISVIYDLVDKVKKENETKEDVKT